MNNAIKISVIVPIYNAEKFLNKCLESISSQNLKEIEIICVNDGSIDNSKEILDKWVLLDKRIIVINKENGGASSARNIALKVSAGEYCLNIDGDDWIGQNYLLDMYNKAKKNDLDILISDLLFDYEDNKKNFILKDLDISDEEILTGKEYLNKFYSGNEHAYSCNKLIRRKLYIDNDLLYNENIFLGEDFEIINKLAYFSKRIGKINKVYYHYRRGENNQSSNLGVKGLYDLLNCKKELERFYKKNNEELLLNILQKNRSFNLMRVILNGKLYIENEYFDYLEDFLTNIKENKIKYSFCYKESKMYNLIILLLKTSNVLNKKIQKKIIYITNFFIVKLMEKKK